ncbi:MAG: glycosyltransferase family 2 protein [Candidatus Dadabacteria bacterium]|nr:MAG: glycosyltransferase family 2 protein [Candidatus Dadabacteria bacterium]
MFMVSLVIPVYNESEAVGRVLDEVLAWAATVPFPVEVVVVDDGSTDGTVESAGRDGVRVVRHARNRGGGAARSTGVRAARHPVVCVMDGDATYDPRDLTPLCRSLVEGKARFAVGVRRGESGTWPRLRSCVKAALRWGASALAGRPIPDLNSGMMCFRRRDALRMDPYLPRRHSWVTGFHLAAILLGWQVEYLPVSYRPRLGRSSFRPVADTFFAFLQVLRTVTYFEPLRLYVPLFLASSAGAVGSALVHLGRKGTLEESDVILAAAAGMALLTGTLADSMAARHRRGWG